MLTLVTPDEAADETPKGRHDVQVLTYVAAVSESVSESVPSHVKRATFNAKDVHVRPHYHLVDQYQIFFSGGRIGKSVIRPVTVHYTDAHTVYGPIVPDADGGLEFFTVRSECDDGAKYMPESREGSRGGRHFTIACPTPRTTDGDMRDESVALIGPHEDGLATYMRSFAAGEELGGSDDITRPFRWIVVAGTATTDGRHVGPKSWIAGGSASDLCGVRAGPDGLAVIEMHFPVRTGQPLLPDS